jgi:antirestriction protein ArdC
MNADAIKTLTTDALDKLAALLDEGQSERLTALLKTMARFHKYSWHNVFLIAAQRPTATRVAGFQTWRSIGRFVRRGEKGIAILAPIVTRRRADDVAQDAQTEAKTVVGFRAMHVFDVAQTDGEPLPEIAHASGDPGDKVPALRAAIAANGIAIEYADDLDGALGMSTGGRIQVLNGLSPAEELMVLSHEWAHELLHRNGERPGRDTRELEAEAVAFVVGEAVGLDARQASRDYLQLYRGDREALAASLDRIQRAAATILSALDLDG